MSNARNNLSDQSQRWANELRAEVNALRNEVNALKSLDPNAQLQRLSQAVGNSKMTVDIYGGYADGFSGVGPVFTPPTGANRIAMSVSGAFNDIFTVSGAGRSGQVWIQITEVDASDGFTTISVVDYDSVFMREAASDTQTCGYITTFFDIDLTKITPGNYLRVDGGTDLDTAPNWLGRNGQVRFMNINYTEV